MNEAHSHFDARVLRRLRSLGRRLRLYVLLDGAAGGVVAACVLAVMTGLVDYTFRLGWDLRVGQWVSVAIILAAIIWRAILRPLHVAITPMRLAILVERKFPALSSRLVSAVEFADPAWRSTHAAASPALMDAVIAEAETAFAAVPIDTVLASDRARRRLAAIAGCLLASTLVAVAAGPTVSIWWQRNALLREVSWPQRHRLRVEGLDHGKMIVARGDDAVVSAVVEPGYEPPRQVFIEFRSSDGPASHQQMPAVTKDRIRFSHTFAQIAQSLHCRIYGGDATTDEFTVEVVDRPRISEATIEVHPPAYTQLASYELRSGQTVAEVLRGSELHFHILTNKPLVDAALVRQEPQRDVEVGPASPHGERNFVGIDRPAGSCGYYFRLRDPLGLTNLSDRAAPVRFSIRLIADEPPKARLRVKDAGDMITPEAVLPLELDLADQYGLATATLVHQHGEAAAKPIVEPLSGFEPGTKSFAPTLAWSTAAHGIKAGEQLDLYAEAADFDNVAGPNVGRSTTATFRVVSREELLAELNRRELEHRRDFERLLRQQEELYADILRGQDAGRTDTAAPEAEFYTRLARRQRDHAGRLNLIRLQFEQVLGRMRINQLATPEVEARLGRGVLQPIDALYRTDLPQAAAALEAYPAQPTAEALQVIRGHQEAILSEMNRILASLLKWEGYQEAVTLLRDVLKMQREVNEETQQRIEREIFGEPATAPAKP